MIPFIRSFTELMAITESRDTQKDISRNNDLHSSNIDSGQRKKYLRAIEKTEVNLPDLPKKTKRKCCSNFHNKSLNTDVSPLLSSYRGLSGNVRKES